MPMIGVIVSAAEFAAIERLRGKQPRSGFCRDLIVSGLSKDPPADPLRAFARAVLNGEIAADEETVAAFRAAEEIALRQEGHG